MSNLTHLFKVGQKVTYRNNDFDAVKRNIPCVVKETYPDHIIITDTETDTDDLERENESHDTQRVCHRITHGYIGRDGAIDVRRSLLHRTERRRIHHRTRHDTCHGTHIHTRQVMQGYRDGTTQ